MDISVLLASEIREKVLKVLYIYRGANAVILTQIINGNLSYTDKQKKQVANQLARLKEKGLVTSKRLEGRNAGSMYFLSVQGFEWVSRLLSVTPGQQGAMWLKYPPELTQPKQLKDYEYDVYKPPIRQYLHYHLILQSIVALFGKESKLQSLPFRLTLDASKTYRLKSEAKMLKPDLEVSVGNEIYTLEIDRSTESYTQLVSKFQNYKNYMDFMKREGLEMPITKIIFVYDEKSSNYGVSRRWGTIMKAYLEGMQIKGDGGAWPPLELLYVKLGELDVVMDFLIKKETVDINAKYHDFYWPKIEDVLQEQPQNIYRFGKLSIILLTDHGRELLLASHYPFYSSDFYHEIMRFKYEGKAQFKSLHYDSKPEQIIYMMSGISKANWQLNLKNSNIDKGLRYEMDYIFKCVQIDTTA